MKQFTFSKLTKMGDFDEKYGQSYWGETNEQLEPVKFNSMNQNITADDAIEVEEVLLKTSAKGTDYHQLKKVKVVGGTSTTNVSSTQAKVVDRSNEIIIEKLDKILGLLSGRLDATQPDTNVKQSGYEAAKAKADELREPAHTDADAPFDMNDIPF